ncbi:MAG: restriction endonuclease subunit S [Parafannyhessea umbonata]|nr:restriction endonuclease subunit S [Parafannyhessea umbonata]
MSDLLVASFSGEWGKAEGPVLTPVLRTANFNEDGTLDYANPAMRCITDKKVQAKKMRRGDIILEKSGGTPNRSVGILAYYDSDDLALCSNFNQVLRFDECKVVPRYAFYQLRWLKGRNAFDRYTRKTTGLQNLEMKRFGELELLIPEPSTQHRIADTLDKILDTQRQLDGQLTKLDSLVKSRFVEMFGDPVSNTMDWEISTIKETAVTYGDGPFGSNLKSSDYVDEGVRVIRLGNILTGSFSERDRSFVSFEKYERLKKYECKPGEVVIGTLGDPLLRACIVPDFGVPSIHKADCMYYETDKSKVLPVFAMSVINQPTMLKRAMLDMHGQTRARINSTQVGNLPMMLPPLALQQEFADFVNRVDKLRFVFWSFLSVGAAR